MNNQEKINSSIGCDVHQCRYNVNGCNCSLSHIHVGCGTEQNTCCDSFEQNS